VKKIIFLNDNHARIPFSIIGVFLVISSSFTSLYVITLEKDKSEEISSTIDFNEIEKLLRFAEADMSTALNMAGLKGIKKLGETPVIEAFITTYGSDPETVSKNFVREYLMNEMNIYLIGNYLYDSFNDGKYSINVVLPAASDNPINSWDEISFREIFMDLERPLAIPLVTPAKKVTHDAYWSLSLDVKLEIRKLDYGKPSSLITTRNINVSTIITSRYLLLKNLVDKDFTNAINGVSELWSFTTIISNIYSLVRGYKHYQKGKPENVVDNKHLALIVNAGLLFEQGFTFGSIDPMGIIQFVNNTYKTLKNKELNEEDLLNLDLNKPDGFTLLVSDIAQGSANTDVGDDFYEPVDTCLDINLTEITEKILFNSKSIYINFKTPSNSSFKKELFHPFTEQDINDTINYYKSIGYVFIGVTSGQKNKNQTTIDTIKNIINTIYKSKMKTRVTRDPSPDVIIGDNKDYPIDNGTGSWIFVSMHHVDTITKPAKGSINPICTIYEEIYELTWEREHYYSKKINDTWYYYTAIDTKIEKNVSIEVILNFYSLYKTTKNDVVDVFYQNIIFNDPNLEDTLDVYLNKFYHPNITTLVKSTSGDYYTKDITGEYKSWVETEAWNALNEISVQISQIKQDPLLNSKNYPNTFELLKLIKEDLLLKYRTNISSYLNKTMYHNGDRFTSVGKKAVYFIREWYVYKIEQDIIDVFESIDKAIEEQIDKILPDGTGFSASALKDTLKSPGMDALKNQFTIPFGFDMNLKRIANGKLQWGETIRLAVDQYPDYLTPFETTSYEGKNIQTMGLRNICIFGPTGLPILPPTPVTPWIITINIWLIDVKGEYCEFKVLDATGETHFNPIFGHDPQIYVRKEESVYNMNKDTLIGKNTRVSYGFTTVSFAVVPQGGYMVGDWGAYSEEDGWS
jgi:hypothetical protein